MVKPVKVRSHASPKDGPKAKESISQPDLQGEVLQNSQGDQCKAPNRSVLSLPGNRPGGDSGQGNTQSLTQELSQNVETSKDQPTKRLKHWEKGLALMNGHKPMAQPGALDSVLGRLERGEKVTEIAQTIGITDIALYRQLLVHAPNDWQGIQAGKALKKLDNSDGELDACENGVELGRARERIGLAKWQLERTARSIYGDKLQVEHSVSLETGDLLGAATDLLASVRRRKEKIVKSE